MVISPTICSRQHAPSCSLCMGILDSSWWSQSTPDDTPYSWLTDKTQTLSFSGCFLVLKHKTRLATWSILLLRGHRWFRIRCATEVHRRDQLVALRESIVHPMPANLQITCSPKPMRVHEAAFALLHHRGAHRDHVQGRDRQHETQPLQCRRRPHQRVFPLKAMRFVIQKVLFNIETKTVLFERLELCCFITDHIPRLFAAERPSDSKVHRTEVLVRHRHPVPKTPMARLQRDITHLKGSQVRGMHPKIRLDPDAPVPSQVSQMAHQRRIGKAAIGQKHHLTGKR